MKNIYGTARQIRNSFFDLDNDPHETHDLMAEKPMRAKILKDILIRELAGREEGYTDGERLIPGRRPQNLSRSSPKGQLKISCRLRTGL